MFRTDFDNATTHLNLAILDNTDHIDLVRGRVTINEAHIRFSWPKLSNIIDESFSATNLRVDENKAYIVANENAIAENQNAIAVNHETIAQNQNAITVNHGAITEFEKTIVGYSTYMIINFTLQQKILGWRHPWQNF